MLPSRVIREAFHKNFRQRRSVEQMAEVVKPWDADFEAFFPNPIGAPWHITLQHWGNGEQIHIYPHVWKSHRPGEKSGVGPEHFRKLMRDICAEKYQNDLLVDEEDID